MPFVFWSLHILEGGESFAFGSQSLIIRPGFLVDSKILYLEPKCTFSNALIIHQFTNQSGYANLATSVCLETPMKHWTEAFPLYFDEISNPRAEMPKSVRIFSLFLVNNARLRSNFKNSCFVFQWGFQTLENNKSTRPTAWCFLQFSRDWKLR